MAVFDPLKAAREEFMAINDVLTAMRLRENAAEQAMAQAESELNAIRKLRGFAQIEQGRIRERIKRLELELQKT